MTAVESLESHKQPFHPSHRPCKSRQTSGICTFPPPDDESSLVYRLNAKRNSETINPWVGQNKMPNWTNFSCQRHIPACRRVRLVPKAQTLSELGAPHGLAPTRHVGLGTSTIQRS